MSFLKSKIFLNSQRRVSSWSVQELLPDSQICQNSPKSAFRWPNTRFIYSKRRLRWSNTRFGRIKNVGGVCKLIFIFTILPYTWRLDSVGAHYAATKHDCCNQQTRATASQNTSIGTGSGWKLMILGKTRIPNLDKNQVVVMNIVRVYKLICLSS